MRLSKSRLLKFLATPRTRREILAEFAKYESVEEVLQELEVAQRIIPTTLLREHNVGVGYRLNLKPKSARERTSDDEPETDESASAAG
jgi:hypothetical protein